MCANTRIMIEAISQPIHSSAYSVVMTACSTTVLQYQSATQIKHSRCRTFANLRDHTTLKSHMYCKKIGTQISSRITQTTTMGLLIGIRFPIMQNQIGCFFGNRNDGQIRVGRQTSGHYGRVAHAHTRHAVHPVRSPSAVVAITHVP